MSRIPAIDGWRGVAIVTLLLSHSLAFFPITAHFPGGVFAVDLFFVISGYIITTRLLQVEQSKGALRSFYLRRLFRIVPPAFAYLAALCAISVFFPIVNPQEVLASLFFYRNYQLSLHYFSSFTMHFWSLSIEEHFYLLWPVTFLFAGRKRALWIAILGAIVCAIWRTYDSPTTWITRYFAAGQSSAFFRVIRTDQRMDGLLVGCALAILLTRQKFRDFVVGNLPKEAPLLCVFPILLFLLTANGFPQLKIYFVIAVALMSTVIAPSGVAYRALTWRPLVWMGQLSYSIYIWQQLFLFHFWQSLFAYNKWKLPVGDAGVYLIDLVCILMTAAGSYYFIEQPCIALGRKLSGRHVEAKLLPSHAVPSIQSATSSGG